MNPKKSVKTLALDSQLLTAQILTNDVQVFILCLSYFINTVKSEKYARHSFCTFFQALTIWWFLGCPVLCLVKILLFEKNETQKSMYLIVFRTKRYLSVIIEWIIWCNVTVFIIQGQRIKMCLNLLFSDCIVRNAYFRIKQHKVKLTTWIFKGWLGVCISAAAA